VQLIGGDDLKPIFAVSVMLFLLFVIVPRGARADVYIESACQVTAFDSRCTFTNTGDSQGSACAIAHLQNKLTGDSTESSRVCSGDLAPHSTSNSPIIFVKAQPVEVCGGVFENCAVQVTMSDVRVTGFAVYLPWLGLAVVGLTSLWVFLDARQLGARQGLLGGGARDNSPGGWFAFCLFLWIVGFPLYLVTRGRIRAASSRPA
jgi:hypothetical protein